MLLAGKSRCLSSIQTSWLIENGLTRQKFHREKRVLESVLVEINVQAMIIPVQDSKQAHMRCDIKKNHHSWLEQPLNDGFSAIFEFGTQRSDRFPCKLLVNTG